MGKVAAGEGLRAYYKGKIEELEIQIRDKQHNLKRMEAQRNELNTQGGLLRGAGGRAPPGAGWAPGLTPYPLELQCGCFGRSCSCCRSRAATWGR